MQINTYLNFPGNCEAALHFYEKTLGAKIMSVMHFKGSPMEAQASPEMADKVMHAAFELAGQVFLASDDIQMDPAAVNKPFALTISLPASAETERLFAQLAEGGQVKMPFQKTFWAEGFGMLVDRFGIPWMFNCEKAA